MGFWNDGIVGSSSRNRSRSRSRTRSSVSKHHEGQSTSRGHGENSEYYASRPNYSRSASSFFSNVTGSGGTPRGRSYNSRAKPRSGFIAKLRKFLRDLYMYMRKNPVKVFFLVIMPLITGGALTKILSQFGVRLPAGLQQMVGSQMGRGVTETERFYARGGARDFGAGSALPGIAAGMANVGTIGNTLQSAMGIAKMFM